MDRRSREITGSAPEPWSELHSTPEQAVTPIAVTVKEAARLLGTNDKQIRRGIYARELPVVRFGNSYSIGLDDLRAWFNRKKGVL